MDKIAVLDFGGQYAHLIANRVRRLGVYSEILDGATSAKALSSFKGIILSGGPQSVYEKDAIKCDPDILKLGVPLLGICYGHQLLAHIQGARVEQGKIKEYGQAELAVHKKAGIFRGLLDRETVWMSHGDTVAELPEGAHRSYEKIGSTADCEFAAIADLKRNFYGIQFHLEVTHTLSGQKMLESFVEICGCAREWKIENYLQKELQAIQKKVGDKKVFMMVSGGVDSTVAFALLEKALGPERVYGLFVDTGFLRLNEKEEVSDTLRLLGFNNLHVRDCRGKYFAALKEVYDPEQKRKIIGELFLKIQAEVVEELGLNPAEWLLGQGTIYPDTIETGGTRHAAKIKTHHNRVPQVEELMAKGLVIEPLAQLYKDEVRLLGKKLGLPEKIIWRHPFPGPGLAVRCLCVKEESWPKNHEKLDTEINKILSQHKLSAKLLPIQSVGVQGDFRTYRHPLAVFGKADFGLLEKLSTQLTNQFQEINRVVLMLSPAHMQSAAVQSIAVKKSYLTPQRIQLLQKADAVVSRFMGEHDLEREIWQFPTVLLPVHINQNPSEVLVLRPVRSEEAMTANFYKMDPALLQKLVAGLQKVEGISAIFYDVTNKPPATIEWE